jgi:hypothetical protein
MLGPWVKIECPASSFIISISVRHVHNSTRGQHGRARPNEAARQQRVREVEGHAAVDEAPVVAQRSGDNEDQRNEGCGIIVERRNRRDTRNVLEENSCREKETKLSFSVCDDDDLSLLRLHL